jgi:predicted dienelactone hydrolase
MILKPLSPGKEKEFLQRWKSSRLGGNIKEKYLDRILELELKSRLKAPGAGGKFPLIIYSPSINSSPYENVVLIEYLVSHGYIVASYPSSGQYSGVMTTDWQGIMTCVQDAEFVLNYMHSFPRVDFEHIGGFGFSWGGITNVISGHPQLSFSTPLLSWTVP